MKKVMLVLVAVAAACWTAPATAQEFAPSHLAAADELLEAARMQDVMDASMNAMLEMQIQQQPELAELEHVMREFFTRYISWDAVRGEYARMYASRFTEAELRQIVAFYRTPVGQKLASVTPDLTIEGGRLGERLVEENLGALQAMVMDALAGSN